METKAKYAILHMTYWTINWKITISQIDLFATSFSNYWAMELIKENTRQLWCTDCQT